MPFSALKNVELNYVELDNLKEIHLQKMTWCDGVVNLHTGRTDKTQKKKANILKVEIKHHNVLI